MCGVRAVSANRKNQRVVFVERDWYVKLTTYLLAEESVAMQGEGTNRVLMVPTTGKGLIFKPELKSENILLDGAVC